MWCGLPDPAQTRKELATSTDHERELLAHVIVAIAELDEQGTGLTVGQILERLAMQANQARRFTFVQWIGKADPAGLPPPRSLGMKLANARERVVNGLQLWRNDERWLVRRLRPEGTEGSTGSGSGRSPSSSGEEDP